LLLREIVGARRDKLGVKRATLSEGQRIIVSAPSRADGRAQHDHELRADRAVEAPAAVIAGARRRCVRGFPIRCFCW